MPEIASAWISILPSTSRFGARLTSQVSTDVNKAGKKAGLGFSKVFAAAAAVGIGAKATAFLKGAIGDASAAQQSLGATSAIFGKFSDSVIRSSKAAAQQYGLSANQYRESANLLGSLFKNQGVSLNQLGGSTDKMIGRAADLAAMFGGTTADAVAALGSAFKGEFDPLDKYGITLNQTAINAELARRGQDKLTGAALASAKQQATSNLILRQSTDAMGTFGRESRTLAGQQQRLSAQWTNMKARLGSALLPVLTKVAGAVNTTLLPGVSRLAGAFSSGSGGGLLTTLKNVAGTVGRALLPVLKTAATTFQTVILPAVTSFASYMAAKLGPVFSDIAGIVSRDVLPLLSRFGQFLYGTVIPAVVKVAGQVGQKLKPVFDQLVATFRKDVLPTIQKLIAKFKENLPAIQKIVGFLGRWIGTLLKLAATVLGKVLPPVIKFAGFLFKTVVPAIATVIGWVIKIIAKVAEFAGKILDAGEKVVGFVKGLKDKFGDAVDFVKGIPKRILNALGDLGSTLLDTGKDVIRGLINGLKEKAGDVKDFLVDMVKDAVGGVTDFLGISSPSKMFKQIGIDTLRGMVLGLIRGEGPLQKRLTLLSRLIERAVNAKVLNANSGRQWQRWIDQTGKQFDRLNARVAKANDKLKSLVSARADLMRSTASSLRGEFNLSDLLSNNTNEFGFSTLTFDTVRSSVRAMVARVRLFATRLYQLRRRGFPSALISEVAGLGSTDGTRVANVLLSGSRREQHGLQADLRALNAATINAGAQVARATYDGRIADAERDVRVARAVAREFERNLSRLRLDVKVGADNRTKAQWYKDGKRLAGVLD